VSDLKTRRFFLGALTAASAVRVWGANDKVNVGIVSLGGRGTKHLLENFSGTKKVDQLTQEAGAPKRAERQPGLHFERLAASPVNDNGQSALSAKIAPVDSFTSFK